MRCTKQETQLKLKQGLSFISFFFFKNSNSTCYSVIHTSINTSISGQAGKQTCNIKGETCMELSVRKSLLSMRINWYCATMWSASKTCLQDISCSAVTKDRASDWEVDSHLTFKVVYSTWYLLHQALNPVIDQIKRKSANQIKRIGNSFLVLMCSVYSPCMCTKSLLKISKAVLFMDVFLIQLITGTNRLEWNMWQWSTKQGVRKSVLNANVCHLG